MKITSGHGALFAVVCYLLLVWALDKPANPTTPRKSPEQIREERAQAVLGAEESWRREQEAIRKKAGAVGLLVACFHDIPLAIATAREKHILENLAPRTRAQRDAGVLAAVFGCVTLWVICPDFRIVACAVEGSRKRKSP